MKLSHFIISTTAALLSINTAFAAMPNQASGAAAFTPAQTQDIKTIVHDYLVSNPEVLVEASQALQVKQMEKMQAAALSGIATNKDQIFNDTQTPIAGNPKGSVKLVEFYDYQCGHCREMAGAIDNIISKNSNVKVIMKDWPIFGGSSKEAAQASVAAYQQGASKFFEFHNALYKISPPLTTEKILDAAKNAGLNVNKLKADMKNPAIEKLLKANFELASKLRLVGTPAFILTNKDETEFKFVPGATTEKDLQDKITFLSK